MNDYDDFDAMWGGTEAAAPASNEPIPEGKYDAVVRGTETRTWDDGGKTLSWQFAIVGGPYDGRITWMKTAINPEKLGKIKGHLSLFGLDKLPTFSAALAALPSVVGRRVKISVTKYQDKLYTHLNDIDTSVHPATTPPPVAAPVAAPKQADLTGVPANSGIPFA